MIREIPILMYHSLDPSCFPNKMAVSPKTFERHITFLQKWFDVIPLSEAVHRNFQQGWGERKAVITFDDGYEDNYAIAFPALRDKSLPATFFISVSQVGDNGFMTWEMIQEMSDAPGIEIASHGTEHNPLKDISQDRARQSIEESKKILEEKLSKPMAGFSYPSGSFDGDVVEMVRRAGYEYACAASRLPHPSFKKSPFAVQRIKISESSSNLFLFVFRLSGFYNFFRKS